MAGAPSKARTTQGKRPAETTGTCLTTTQVRTQLEQLAIQPEPEHAVVTRAASTQKGQETFSRKCWSLDPGQWVVVSQEASLHGVMNP